MDKRLPNPHTWQWRGYADNHRHPTNLALQLIALPLFVLAALLIADGLFSSSVPSFAIGVIGLVAARVFQRRNKPS
ncbi:MULTISPECIES: hypothetical protein [Pseudomonas]|uniref:hypothetical protein n=1 Tax=Pseudomonas TaxID=286 RepID=UPI000C0A9612|nr:hypothetical protein [Pseudomonas alliivorans]PHN62855.1 hypothetical protein AO275_02880 [Pseudomonas viridiflava]